MSLPSTAAELGAVRQGSGTESLPAPTELFGIAVQTAPPADLLREILGFVERSERRHVGYVNAHVLNQSFASDKLRASLRAADLVYCDGYGVQLAAKLIGLPVPYRMSAADWIWKTVALCEESRRSLYLLGSDPGASTEAATALQRWHPHLRVTGTHHGYFDIDSPHSERVLEHIEEEKPDILLVGMGTPQQELWVNRYFDRIDAHVIWTVGALFDHLSGREPRVPRWIADHGFERVFHRLVEPRRMWRRYLLGSPVFWYRVWQERLAAGPAVTRTRDHAGGAQALGGRSASGCTKVILAAAAGATIVALLLAGR